MGVMHWAAGIRRTGPRTRLAIVCAAVACCALPAQAAAATKTVYAGGPANLGKLLPKSVAQAVGPFQPSINAFLLTKVTIHAGDSVKFVLNGFHTIDLPGSTNKDLPLILPGPTVTGVNDFSGTPFWFNGHVPSLSFNPQLIAPIKGSKYNGTKRIDSGLPLGSGAPKPLTVKFTKAGTYKYFCDVHPGMIGYVVVRPKGKSIPSKKKDAATLQSEVNAQGAAAVKLTKVKQPADHVSLGESDSLGLELYSMFPSTLNVNAGTTVTFSMSPDTREVHTASFGPTAYLTQLSNAVGPPGPSGQVALYPSDSPAAGPIPVTPTSHGNGFANSGGLDQDPTTPLPTSTKFTFTTPGTYHFECLIHPFMQGTIVVH